MDTIIISNAIFSSSNKLFVFCNSVVQEQLCHFHRCLENKNQCFGNSSSSNKLCVCCNAVVQTNIIFKGFLKKKKTICSKKDLITELLIVVRLVTFRFSQLQWFKNTESSLVSCHFIIFSLLHCLFCGYKQ